MAELILVGLGLFTAAFVGRVIASRYPRTAIAIGIAVTIATLVYGGPVIWFFLHLGPAGWVIALMIGMPALLLAAAGVHSFRLGLASLEREHAREF